MSRKTVFEYMPGRRTDMHEHNDGSVTFDTVQDVEPILEYNKMMMNEYGDKLTPGKRGTWHKVASVPVNIWEQWLKMYCFNMPDRDAGVGSFRVGPLGRTRPHPLLHKVVSRE